MSLNPSTSDLQIHQQMENAGFEPDASLLSVEQIQDIVGRRVTPVFQPI